MDGSGQKRRNLKMTPSYKQHQSSKTGMLPGTIVYIGELPAKPSHAWIHIYSDHEYQKGEGFDLDLIHKALAQQKHVWVDITGLGNVDDINQLCAEFGVHPLIIEDIVNTHQRPKLEVFEHYQFMVFKLLNLRAKALRYNTEQFSMLVKKNLIMTFRESNQYDMQPLYQRLGAELSMIRQQGSDYLTYLIMDNIVDNYFNFVERSTHELEVMENFLIEDAEKIQLKMIYSIKRHSLTLRKTIAPIRDIIHLLLQEKPQLIKANYRLYYQDLYDHTLRLLESVDLHYDMASSMLDIYLSTQNNRMSQTMKVLTQFASLFIPLTVITGIYGMNFEYMPELKWHYGYFAVLGLMGFVFGGMLYYFKKMKIF